jgi:hypothetical protein
MTENDTYHDERVVHGLWWVAEAAAHRVAGLLRYGSRRGILLELSTDLLPGLAGNREGQQKRWCERPSVILGQSDGNREIFTITDARAFSIGPELRFFANHVLVGQHLPNIEVAGFLQIHFELEYLEAWAGGPLLARDAQDKETAFEPRTIFAFQTETGHYELQCHAYPFFRERESGSAYTCTVLATMSEPLELPGVMAEIEKFVSLMTILVGALVRPRRVSVSQVPEKEQLEVIASWAKTSFRSLSHHDMLVPLYALGAQAEAVFSKWFADWAVLRQSVAMLLTACSTTYTTASFLCLVSGLESFHRATMNGKYLADEEFEGWQQKLSAALPRDMPPPLREKLEQTYAYANEVSLRSRLTALLRDVLGLPSLEYSQKDRKGFVGFVVNTRNQLAHGTAYPDKDQTLAHTSLDLKSVLLRLLLSRLGCSDETIGSAGRRLPAAPLSGAEQL